MDHGSDYLSGLAQLHQLDDADERRAVWRRGLASLAVAAEREQPTPLEGVARESLLASVRVALATGLIDDLGWLSRPVAATALFEIAAALPQGAEKRELGRRVLEALHTGGASTFVPLATSLALSSPRAFSTAPVRARVGVALRLPISMGTGVDGLALALLCRRELEQEWVSSASTGPLPARRIAARLVERAAREASRRMDEGDDTGLKVFRRPSVRAAWTRLLCDRESLVWRHAATARGLLVAADPALTEEIERGLDPRRGPLDWRRAVTSLGASVAHDPAGALARCRQLVASDLFGREPGLAGAMVFGLSRAAAAEPEAAEELLPKLAEVGDVDALEALADLLWEHGRGSLGQHATEIALERLLVGPGPFDDDGLLALREALLEELSPAKVPRTLRAHVGAALLAYAEGHDVRPHTAAAVEAAHRAVAELEGLDDESSEGRRRAFQALRELDLGLLETTVLGDLVAVAGEAGGAKPMGNLFGRLESWLVEREKLPTAEWPIPHLTLRFRRLRTLLHLVDCEGVTATDETPAASANRRLARFQVLLARMEDEPLSPLRRTFCTMVARAAEGLMRDDLLELSDLVVAVSSQIWSVADLRALAEASVVPETRDVLAAAAEVVRRLETRDADTMTGRSLVDAFAALADALPPGISARVEALRRALVQMAEALRAIHGARSLTELRQGDAADGVESLEQAVHYAAQLSAGARRRLHQPSPAAGIAGPALRALDAAVDRAARDAEVDLVGAVRGAIEGARADLPSTIAEVIARVLGRIPSLPGVASDEVATATASAAPEQRLRLPAWLPPSRIIGGFYVLRPIGHGTGGSVFVARRAEERHDEAAELYALKVPTYDGSVAQTLSEEQFLQLFREEAGALVSLPPHANLAGFVGFDGRARPKPLLVMELVQGPTLERVLQKRELSVSAAFAIVDGIAAGLEAMHATGIGHLDLKPANVILRSGSATSSSRLVSLSSLAPVAVLVDFGLAGRKVRPGCASPYYGAPEVWDTQGLGPAAEPTAADVYSFCALAYELLTGTTLFTAESLPALIASHFSHDGNPPGLAQLRGEARLSAVADVLSAGLVAVPKDRPAIRDLRAALAGLAPDLDQQPWPVLSSKAA